MRRRRPDWHAVAAVTALALVPPATAQWSSDPAENLPLAAEPDQQTQPKIATTADGGAYVSWFDSDATGSPPFGFDVVLQRLDADGVPQWAAGGVRLADRGFSSTTDYDLGVHADGSALVTFRDDRFGTVEQITATKVDPSGVQVWGPTGVQLTASDAFKADPKIAGTTDGGVVVAWTHDDDTLVQKLDADGIPVWGSGVRLRDADGGTFSAADLVAAEAGTAILSWVRAPGGFGGDRHLWANKLAAADGALLWGAAHVRVLDSGSLQFGNFPGFVSDGAGGGVFAWYTSSPSLQVFAQRLDAGGNELFPHDGVPVSTLGTQVRVSPDVAYDAATEATYVFWTEENGGQSAFGVSGQKLDASGARQWGDAGVAVTPLGSRPVFTVRALATNDGAKAFWVEEESFGRQVGVFAALDADGTFACTPRLFSSLPADKSRLVAARAANGVAELAWSDGRDDAGDIYAQNVNPDCSLGIDALDCADVAAGRLRCRGGDVQIGLLFTGTQHDGELVVVEVNGVPLAAPIEGDRVVLTAPGAGVNTIELVEPAGCFPAVPFLCP